MEIEKTLKLAIEHHKAGRLIEALRVYKQVLAADPNEPDALRLMGQLYFAAGNYPVASDLVRKAISFRSGVVDFHIDLARILRAAGDINGSVESFSRALQLNPFDDPATRLELAQALAAGGRAEEAIEQARRAVESKPTADSLNLLGNLLLYTQRYQEALDRLKRAIELAPQRADLIGGYGLALQHRGDFELAEAQYRRSLQIDPRSPDVLNCLGKLLVLRRKLPEAIVELRKALELRPQFAMAHLNMALAYTGMGQTDEALAGYRAALELDPNYADAWDGLGRVLLDLREYTGAVAAFTRLVAILPSEMGYRMLSTSFGGLDDLDSSIKAAREAIRIAPQSAEAHAALGNELRWTGALDEAIAEFRTALALDPNDHAAHSNLVYTLLAKDELTPKQILDEHIAWGRQQTGSIAPLRPPRNVRAADRRLRVGYLSNNFRQQAVSSFVLPIVKHHDRVAVEVFCYNDLEVSDNTTRQYQQLADQWRETAGLSDEQLARQVRDDRIDILVELTGHIGKGRLRALAHKPSPIQISYIGYQGTTGVSAVDYVLTDDWADPKGAEANYLEKPWRLPESFFVYDPPGDAPLVDPLPAQANGWVTFGCLNAVWKATPRSVKLWGRVLSEVPNSRITLLTTHCKETNQRLIDGFGRCGIALQRVQLVHRSTPGKYLRRYGGIDIALDPVPFNGHTTTCDAAWMGCPTVTLSGSIYAHRYGGSVLRNLNLPQLVAENEEAYVSAAVAQANDLDHLAKLRSTLRFTMQDSIITDGKRFTANLEHAYRQMWRQWCAAPIA